MFAITETYLELRIACVCVVSKANLAISSVVFTLLQTHLSYEAWIIYPQSRRLLYYREFPVVGQIPPN